MVPIRQGGGEDTSSGSDSKPPAAGVTTQEHALGGSSVVGKNLGIALWNQMPRSSLFFRSHPRQRICCAGHSASEPNQQGLRKLLGRSGGVYSGTEDVIVNASSVIRGWLG